LRVACGGGRPLDVGVRPESQPAKFSRFEAQARDRYCHVKRRYDQTGGLVPSYKSLPYFA